MYSDTKSKTELFKTISIVKNVIAETQEEKRNIAYVHCHAEQIELGKSFYANVLVRSLLR